MKTQFLSTMFGAALAVGAMAVFAQPQSASAMTLPINPVSGVTTNVDLELPVEQVRRRHRGYRRHRHGRRFRHQRRGHRNYYNGFWYAVPWWLGTPAPYYRAPYYAPRRGSRHVRWCLNRYRSYRPRTDTYRGYDGYDHRCRSPYRR